MTINNSNIQYISIALTTDKPVRKTPYQVKGSIMKKYPKSDIVPMLNGSYRKKYLYPRVQVKILNEKIYFLGIGEGVNPVKRLIKNLKILDFGNITFDIKEIVSSENGVFKQTNEIHKYKFITPWVALNKSNSRIYLKTPNNNKRSFLNKLLGKNLIFLSKEFNIELGCNILTDVDLDINSLDNCKETKDLGFEGYFFTNFILPNFIGLGNGITRGYGSFQYVTEVNKNLLNLNSFSELSHVDTFSRDKIKKNKTTTIKNKKNNPSKHYNDNESEINYNTLKNNISSYDEKIKKKNSRRKKKKKLSSSSLGNKNFNSEEYHKKQHSLWLLNYQIGLKK